MVDVPTKPQGNSIVPTSTPLDFPTLVLGGIVVGTSVYLVSEKSEVGGWALTILLLLAIAYSQRSFATEIQSLLSRK